MNEKILDDFVSNLTKEKIKEFNKLGRDKQLEIKTSTKDNHLQDSKLKLSRLHFLNIMNFLFSEKFEKVYEQLLKRFQIIKYELRPEKIKTNDFIIDNEKDCFSITDIVNDEKEIDIYELTVALIIYTKFDFKEKIQLLFEITDVDSDGYINEVEIRNIFNTSHLIFSDEENSSKSSILNQSMAIIKSKQVLEKILYYPGNLFNLIKLERYVTFNQFYNSIEKISNYKYFVIPSFVSIKSSIYLIKSEPEFSVNQRHLSDFLTISEDMLLSIKGLVGVNQDFHNKKKIFDAKSEINSIRRRTQKNAKMLENQNLNIYVRKNSILPPLGKIKNSEEEVKSIKSKMKGIFNPSKISITVNFQDLNCVDVQPGRLKIIDKDGKYNSNSNPNYKQFRPINDVIANIKKLNDEHKNENHQEVLELQKLIPDAEIEYKKLEAKLNPRKTVKLFVDVSKFSYKKLYNNS